MESEKHYMYELVTPSEDAYKKLVDLQKNHPELTFKNEGYEKLSKEIQERHTDQIKEIDAILTETLENFRTFNNFSPSRDGKLVAIRVQYAWDSSFQGVGYFDMRHWNPEDHGKY